MRSRTESLLKGLLLAIGAGVVGAAFYLGGLALGIAFAGIAAILLFLHWFGAAQSDDEMASSITNNPAFSDWEGNIFHKQDSLGGFKD